MSAGRSCPIAYRYGANALARATTTRAETLYVVGGLYGNPFALRTLIDMAAREEGPVRLCFNGDFNWFNVDDAGFRAINECVLQHDAIVGNVEYEFRNPVDDAGCGCAYPDGVDQGVVERSNRIHARLKHSAARHPDLLAQLAALPLYARYQVGDCRVGIVHGDADSLAGWHFDPAELDRTEALPDIQRCFAQAQVDVFASSHTCSAGLRRFALPTGEGLIVNNGAAGMRNCPDVAAGLLTRIATKPSPHPVVQEEHVAGVCIAALPIPFDSAAWQAVFLSQWAPGSDAHTSYFTRIEHLEQPFRTLPGTLVGSCLRR